MTDDIALAFALPEDRAIATASGEPCDRLSVRDHVVEADIGAFQQERGVLQRLRFNVVAEVGQAPPHSDDVDRILSYDRITEAIEGALTAARVDLLETLAERVAEGVLAAPQTLRVFVRVEKLDRGPGALGVEIVRSASDAHLAAARAATARPVVAVLGEDAAMGDIGIDALRAGAASLILVVGPPKGMDVPRTGDPMTQGRVDLLAIEQGAWMLSARIPGCSVVATRTEMDWAVEHGHTIVWAPSRMVLDAVGGPDAHDPVTLAIWLADRISATRLVLRGVEDPSAEAAPQPT